MATRRIKITNDIIDRSVRANSSHCMIADAVHEQVPDANYVSVDLQTIRFSVGEERFVYFTPRIAQVNLIKFDQGDTDIEPFSFALGRPTQIVQRHVKREVLPEPERIAKSAGGRKGGKRSQEKAKLMRSTLAKKGATKIGGRTPPAFSVDSNLGNRRVFGLKVAHP